MVAMRRDLWAVSIDDAQTRDTIKRAYATHQVVLEPHGVGIRREGLRAEVAGEVHQHVRDFRPERAPQVPQRTGENFAVGMDFAPAVARPNECIVQVAQELPAAVAIQILADQRLAGIVTKDAMIGGARL